MLGAICKGRWSDDDCTYVPFFLAMKAIGVDAKRISSRSMRRGGITAARLAGVAIQSGHGQHRVGRRYTGDSQRRGLLRCVKCLGQGPLGQTLYGLGVLAGN